MRYNSFHKSFLTEAFPDNSVSHLAVIKKYERNYFVPAEEADVGVSGLEKGDNDGEKVTVVVGLVLEHWISETTICRTTL